MVIGRLSWSIRMTILAAMVGMIAIFALCVVIAVNAVNRAEQALDAVQTTEFEAIVDARALELEIRALSELAQRLAALRRAEEVDALEVEMAAVGQRAKTVAADLHGAFDLAALSGMLTDATAVVGPLRAYLTARDDAAMRATDALRLSEDLRGDLATVATDAADRIQSSSRTIAENTNAAVSKLGRMTALDLGTVVATRDGLWSMAQAAFVSTLATSTTQIDTNRIVFARSIRAPRSGLRRLQGRDVNPRLPEALEQFERSFAYLTAQFDGDDSYFDHAAGLLDTSDAANPLQSDPRSTAIRAETAEIIDRLTLESDRLINAAVTIIRRESGILNRSVRTGVGDLIADDVGDLVAARGLSEAVERFELALANAAHFEPETGNGDSVAALAEPWRRLVALWVEGDEAGLFDDAPEAAAHFADLSMLIAGDDDAVAGLADKISGVIAARREIAETVASVVASGQGLTAAMDAFTLTTVEAGKTALDSVMGAQQNSRLVLMVGVVVSIVISVIIALGVLGPRIAGRAQRLTDMMTRLADGQKVEKIEMSGSDEIARMARTLDVFRSSMDEAARLRSEQEERAATLREEKKAEVMGVADDFDRQVGSVINDLSHAAAALRDQAVGMSRGSQDAFDTSQSASRASSIAAESVDTVAMAAGELTDAIRSISDNANRSNEIARQATSRAEMASDVVRGLAASANRIGEVVTLITDIAEQTNLLALNATIEAARAGEAGRGFAVVAQEVKTLASQTAQATGDIDAQVQTIQQETQHAVAAIEAINGIIGEIATSATAISDDVLQQIQRADDITSGVDKARDASRSVSEAITHVEGAAANQQDNAARLEAHSGKLSDGAERLRDEVGRFLDRVRTG